MSDEPSTADLMTSAATGSKQAWDALVDRYAPLVWFLFRWHRLDDAQAGRAGQAVWTQLASQLSTIAGPAELAGWLTATMLRECGACGPRTAGAAPGAPAAGPQTAARDTALRQAFSRLTACQQQLIIMIAANPAATDSHISAVLGIPADRIGPTRRHCLDQLRRDPAIAQIARSVQ
jgi:hypothetical protein